MKESCRPSQLLALALLASCASPRVQEPVDVAAIDDLVARIEATVQEQVGQLLRTVSAQVGEERALLMARRVLLEGERPSAVTDKVLAHIELLGPRALPLVREAVRLPRLRPASVWALQRHCIGVTPQSADHPLANDDIEYLGSLLVNDPDTAKAAAVTLKSAGHRQRIVLPALIEAVRKQSARPGAASSGLCSSLLICIGHVGSAAESAAPIVLRKLDDEPDASMRTLILWTLCNIMPDCKKALTTLIEALAPPEEREGLLRLLANPK